MLNDLDDDEIVAFGWPWHGLVKIGQDVQVVQSNGSVKTLVGVNPNNFYLGRNATWVFDRGRPDVADPIIEAEGGAWWGRAIMRDGLFWTGATWETFANGKPSSKRQDFSGFPLWWEDAPDAPTERAVVYIYGSSNGAVLAADIVSHQRLVTRTFTLNALGQGLDQPPVAALRGQHGSDWALAGIDPGDMVVNGEFCGAHQNRLLFLLYAQALSSASSIPTPRALSATSLGHTPQAPVDPPRAPCGLIEVEIDRGLFGSDWDANAHLSVRVVEDRKQALGNPRHNRYQGGHTLPGDTLATVTEEVSETSALLTAWYDPAGNIRTARFNRVQRVATTDRRLTQNGAFVGNYMTYSNHAKLELSYDGLVVDSRILNETIERNAGATSYSFTRIISATGEEDDVAIFSDDRYRGTGGAVPEVNAERAGGNLSFATYAYILQLEGVDVLRKQDIRMLHMTRHSNNVASICTSSEPYDYPSGGASYSVQAVSGPAIGPNGPAGGTMSATLTKRRTSWPTWSRSFFSLDTRRWSAGAGNPITGQFVRAVDHYDGSSVEGSSLTWV